MGILDAPAIDYRAKPVNVFDPRRDLPNLYGWYDPSQTLTSLSDSTGVSRLRDLSGFGQDLVQNTSGNRPTKQTHSNGKAIVRFVGSSSHFLRSDLFGQTFPVTANYSQPLTMTVVAKASSSSGNSGDTLLVGGVGSSATCQMLIEGGTTKALYGKAGNLLNAIGPSVCDDAWHVMTVVFDGTMGFQVLDGFLTSSKNTMTGTEKLAQLFLGGFQSTNYYTGDIAEVLISGRLTLEQIEKLHTVLGAKWS